MEEESLKEYCILVVGFRFVHKAGNWFQLVFCSWIWISAYIITTALHTIQYSAYYFDLCVSTKRSCEIGFPQFDLDLCIPLTLQRPLFPMLQQQCNYPILILVATAKLVGSHFGWNHKSFTLPLVRNRSWSSSISFSFNVFCIRRGSQQPFPSKMNNSILDGCRTVGFKWDGMGRIGNVWAGLC